MLDNLRDQASSSIFDEEPPVQEPPPKPKKVKRPRRTFDQVTGMNAQQRFILVFLLFLMVCMLGVALLLITGKVVPPATF